jgi:hypothetical protein
MMTDFFLMESGITSVNTEEKNAPVKVSVSQNYSNPFNPSTTIALALAVESFVSLKVLDSLGQEVSTLVSEEMLPGTYSRQWNAEGLASGVYFYRIQVGSYTETKKLTVIR